MRLTDVYTVTPGSQSPRFDAALQLGALPDDLRQVRMSRRVRVCSGGVVSATLGSMSRPAPTACLAFALLLGAGPVHAQAIYRWTDGQGTTHFTDDAAGIPEAFRNTAQTVDVSKPGPALLTSAGTSERSAPDASVVEQRSVAARASEEASRERWWRATFQTARERVAQLERALAADRAAADNPRAAGMPVARQLDGTVLPSRAYEALRQRLPAEEAELREARAALEALEREASREAVPREWRR